MGEEDIVKAMRVVWERMKILIEPSSAVLLRKVQGARIGVILSGGNVDLSKLPFT